MPAPNSQAIHPIAVRRSSSRVAYFDSALPDDLADVLWLKPEDLLTHGEPLRWVVRRTVMIEWESHKYVIKHYVEQSRRHAFKHLFQPCRAQLTWAFMRRLADAGIATPRPVACIENRWGPLRRDSYLMYPYIEGVTLNSYFADNAVNKRSSVHDVWQQLHLLWRQLAQLRASLEDANFGNFIVSPVGRLWLIDLDKSRFHRLAFIAHRNQQRCWRELISCASNWKITPADAVATSN